MHLDTYYSISMEMVLEWRYGPFGLFKKTETIITQTGKLYPGSTIDLYDDEKVKVGTATLKEDGILKVVPEGDVLVDMGDLQSIEISVITTDANGVEKEMRVPGLEAYETKGNMTIKSRDGRKKVHLVK